MNQPETPAPRRRPLWARIGRVFAKILAWVLGIVLGLLLLAWLAILIFFPDDKIRRLALEEITARTGLVVTAGELDLEILSGLVLEDVRVVPPEGFERSPLTIGRVVVDYSLSDLLDDRLQIRSLRIERPEVYLAWRGGRSNLEALLEQVQRHRASAPPADPQAEADAGEPFQIDLEEVAISRADVALDLPGEVALRLDGLSGQLSGLLAGPGGSRLELGLQLAAGRADAIRIGPAGPRAGLGLQVEASVTGFEVVRASVEVRISDLRMAAEAGPESMALVARLGFELDLGSLGLTVAPLKIELDGTELLVARASLPKLGAGLAFGLTLERLHLGHPGLARFAGPGLSLGPGAWVRGASLSGDLRDLWSTDAKVPISFDVLDLDSPLARVRGGRGKLSVAVEAAPEGGRHASLDGELGAASVRVGPVSLSGFQAELDLSTSLDGSASTPGLLGPEFKLVGRAARVGTGLADLEATTFDLGLKARAVTEPGPGAAVQGLAVELRADAERLSLAGARVARPSLRISASAARLSAGEGGAELHEPDVLLRAGAGQAVAGGVRVARPSLELRATGTRHRLAAELGQPVRLRTRLTTGAVTPKPGGGARVPAGSGIAALDLRLDTRLSSTAPARLPVGLRLDMEQARVGRGPGLSPWGVDGRIRVELDGDFQPARARLGLARFQSQVGDLLQLDATGWVDIRQPAMEVGFSTSEHDLKALAAGLPEDIRIRIPALTGKVRMAGEFKGPLRVAQDHRHLPFSVDLTVHNIGVGLQIPQAGLALSGVEGPVRLSAGPAFDQQVRSTTKLKLASARVGGQALIASGVVVELASSLVGDQLKADGWVTAARLGVGDAWPQAFERVRLDFASMLTGFKDLRLTDFSLALGSVGFTSTGQGQILLTPGSGHIGDVRLSLQTRSRFASDQPVTLPGGLTAQGATELALGVRSEQAGVLRTEGRIAFDGFSVFGPGFAFEGAAGGVPVMQYVRVHPELGLLARGGGNQVAAAQAHSTAYDQALRPLKGQSRSFSIRKLRFKDLVFTDMSGNLELSAGVLSLGSLRFGFLGGDVVADTSVVFAPPERRRLSLDAEMSSIDLSGLGALNLAGASDVSGNLRLGLDWNQRDVTTAFNLTRIGRSTLQALLVALDPKEANPGLVAFRDFLTRYEVSPKEVNLDMRHGLLSMRTRLQMGPLARAAAGFVHGFSDDTFSLPHIPVGNILAKYMDFAR